MEQQVRVPMQVEVDMLKALLYIRLAKSHVNDLIIENPNIKDSIKNGTFRLTREIDKLEDKLIRESDPNISWHSLDLDKEKIWDVNSAIELILRIGKEEKEHAYGQFLSIMMDALSVIFYAQTKRKFINFNKYRSLFKLFCDEVVADTDKQPGLVTCKNGAIYLRIGHEDLQEEIKS